jgi:hypothetical protein
MCRNSVIKFFFLIFFLNVFFPSTSQAQYNEVGVFLGTSRYKGELSPHTFDTKFIHFAAGAFYRHNYTRNWSFKLELNYGKVSGNDAQLSAGFEKNRTLNFTSSILEVTPAFEFNFLPFETGNDRFPFTPYIYTGLTVFHFNPKADLNGQTVKLQPLGTEGQGLSGGKDVYSLTAIAIPIGGGIKINTGSVSIALQVSARRTYTDYLDDVSTTYPDFNKLNAARGPVAVYASDPSLLHMVADTIPIYTGKQRGDSSTKDWYVFAGLNIFVRLNSFWKEFCSPFKRRRY